MMTVAASQGGQHVSAADLANMLGRRRWAAQAFKPHGAHRPSDVWSTQIGYPMPDILDGYELLLGLPARRVADRRVIQRARTDRGVRHIGSRNVLDGSTDENGGAATFAGRHAVGSHVMVLAEILHNSSQRVASIELAPQQEQTTASLRFA